MIFWLGTHVISHMEQTDVPLFVSRRQLAGRKTFPRNRGSWALDSGGFTELQMFGEWRVRPARYVNEVRRFMLEMPGMAWASPQDWMCEDWVIRGGWHNGTYFKGTGLTLEEHQRRTVLNYLELCSRAPDVRWTPVLQGWEKDDYLRCVQMYENAGVDLTASPLVGVGSVCRRQHTKEALEIFRALSALGLSLHAYGLKLKGLQRSAHLLASSDSMAWSFTARKGKGLPGCTGHKNCANCLRYALHWREKAMSAREEGLRNRAPFACFTQEELF